MAPSTCSQRSSRLARRGERLEIVDCAGVDRARGRDHAGRLKALRAVGRYGGFERGEVDPKRPVGRDATQRPVAEAKRLHRFAVAGMDLIRSIEGERLWNRRDAKFAHVDPGLDVARHSQRNDVAHRAAAHERAAGGLRKANHHLQPIHDLPVEEGRGMGAPAEVGSLNRGDEIAERAGEVARAHVPGPEARMDVAHRVGHDVGGDFAPDVRERLRIAGERRFESRKDVAGHLSPDRALANVAQIADGVVQNQARDGKRLVPILRIEAFGASLRFGVVRSRAVMAAGTALTASTVKARVPLGSSQHRCPRRAASSDSARRCRAACRG